MSYTVSEVAALAGVTVRTLHHYDAIGLVRPSGRSPAGYRLYAGGDLARLQHALAYRALGFPLARVKRVLDDPGWDEVAALREQRRLLEERAEHLRHLIVAVDRALEAHAMNVNLTPEERLEVFGEHDPEQHAGEAAERWGEEESYQESARRTRAYTKDDWKAIKAEGEAAARDLAALLAAGVPATDDRAVTAVDGHRAHIDRRFYPCTPGMYVQVLEGQVADQRFRDWWDGFGDGLLDYALEAARVGAAREGTS